MTAAAISMRDILVRISCRRPVRVGRPVMVESASDATAEVDGMRGRVTAIDRAVATVECYADGDSCVIRVPVVELVELPYITA
ncbi:hypothetical protein [Burkholderia gladioli]|uniref:hypothetical protein n=1 Tax=Burkholderia gladioli TaxID=28095 RepID=UPI000D007506|nr:hypothetical protein [Burkholderia gladioli]PRG56864.1 hypothetical protein C6V06_04245 [Burkholderia gladioli]